MAELDEWSRLMSDLRSLNPGRAEELLVALRELVDAERRAHHRAEYGTLLQRLVMIPSRQQD